MSFDVAIVGAGPAGLSAAVHAADGGLSVVLVDAGTQPGGQFWRHPEETPVEGAYLRAPVERTHLRGGEGAGHHDWKRFADLRARLYAHEVAGNLSYWRNTAVWLIEAGRGNTSLRLVPAVDAAPLVEGADHPPAAPDLVSARHVVLCPGGYDRQLPVPGWDLPGVMAAGGVQALLKGNRTAAGRTVVVAGTGPFLLPVATGLAAAGVKVAAICEANSPTGWLRNLRGAVRAPEKVPEGIEYAAALARHRIPYKVRTAVTEIHGAERVEAVTISKLSVDGAVVPGTGRRVACDVVALGWGFTAQLELVLAAGAETDVDVDGSLVAVVDDRLASTVPGVSVAGEATGVGGAAMAVVEGELAALCVAAESSGRAAAGAASLGTRISRLQRDRARLREFAVAMHRANPVPAHWQSWLTPATVVCRCEEVSYGALCTAHAELGAEDARSLKSFARPGMGWCQGRVCG
ncbi:MAG: FAD-dependent oxidoreductase, partial [Specibacter sp.]